MRLWALGLMLCATGCGAMASQVHIVSAQRSLDQATVDDGAHKSPYAYGSASTYLQQARIAASYSHFAQATDLADKAKSYAIQAQQAPSVKAGACLAAPTP